MPKARKKAVALAVAKSARQVGLNYLGGRARTVREVRDHLGKARFSHVEVEAAIAELRRLNLLDDDEFARGWVEARLRDKRPAGARKFAMDLRRRGVEADRVDAVLQEYRERLESDTAVADLLRRQSWRYRGLDQVKAMRRMLDYLSRRGYGREMANRAVRQVWQEMQEDDVAGN